MQVLVVEDSKITAPPLIAYLKKQGHTVTHVENGRAAVDAFLENPPDVVLMDIIMPEMDGPATLSKLRQLPDFETTPVVFMTAKAQPQEVSAYKQLGAKDVIAKPFDPMTLASAVLDIWERRP